MSMFPQIQIEFDAMLAKARAEWQAFKKEVESTPIRVPFDTSGLGGSRRARSVTSGPITFSGASGVPTGGAFVPPPSVESGGPIYYNVGGATIAGPAMPPIDPVEVKYATAALMSPQMGLNQRSADAAVSKALQYGARSATDIMSSALQVAGGKDPTDFTPSMPGLNVDTSQVKRAADRLAAALDKAATVVEHSFATSPIAPYTAGRGGASARNPLTGRFTSAHEMAAQFPIEPFMGLTRYTSLARGGGAGVHVGPGSGPQGFTGWQWGQRRLPRPGYQHMGDETIDAEWSPSGPQAANTGWSYTPGSGGMTPGIAGPGAGGRGPTAVGNWGGVGGGGGAGGPGWNWGPAPAGAGGLNGLGHYTPSNTGSHHLAFAAMFAFFQVQQTASRIMSDRAQLKASERISMYGTLEEQVQEQYQLTQQQESTWGAVMGSLYRGIYSGAATMFGFKPNNRKGSVGSLRDADSLAEAQQVLKQQMAGDKALRESKIVSRSAGSIGLTGLAAEYAQSDIDYQNAMDQIAPARIAAGAWGAAGFGAQEAALRMVRDKRRNEIMMRTNDTLIGLRGASDAAVAVSANRQFDAELINFDTASSVASLDFARSVQGLPNSSTLITAFNSSQAFARQALIAQQQLGVNMAIQRNEYSASANMMSINMGLNTKQANVAAVNAQFLPIFNKQGWIVGFNGMDQSQMGQQEFASRKKLYESEVVNAELRASKADMEISGNLESAKLVLNRRPIEAQRAQLFKEFAQSMAGLDPTSQRFRDVVQKWVVDNQIIDQNESDFKYTADIGLKGQARALKAGLARDKLGANFENLMTGFEQQADQFKGPELRQQRKQVFENQLAAAKLFQQDYVDSFRGESLDTRRFAVNNPRDVQDPSQILDRIDRKMEDIITAIDNVGAD